MHFDDAHESLREAEDLMWSFFQHCWHLRDWLMKDKHWQSPDVATAKAQRKALQASIDQSPWLTMCSGVCNMTKHLGRRVGEARPSHMNANIGAGPRMECIIDDGNGNRLPGHVFADRCIADWDRILQAHALSTAPMPPD
ncbi:MAG: hypothetical protein JSR36_15360 [Proteobacteria bacterium]|nr:hypothetical protein [Pseudomonadota bacterium]